MKKIFAPTFLMLALFNSINPAWSVDMSFDFSGSVDSISGPLAGAPASDPYGLYGVSAGDTLAGSVLWNNDSMGLPTTGPVAFAGGTIESYVYSAPYAMTLTIGGTSFNSSLAGGQFSAVIANDIDVVSAFPGLGIPGAMPGTAYDMFGFVVDVFDGGSAATPGMSVSLGYLYDAGTLSDTSLPGDIPLNPIASVLYVDQYYYDPVTSQLNTQFSAIALDIINVSAQVPEPSTYMLFGLGLFGLIILRRRGRA